MAKVVKPEPRGTPLPPPTASGVQELLQRIESTSSSGPHNKKQQFAEMPDPPRIYRPGSKPLTYEQVVGLAKDSVVSDFRRQRNYRAQKRELEQSALDYTGKSIQRHSTSGTDKPGFFTESGQEIKASQLSTFTPRVVQVTGYSLSVACGAICGLLARQTILFPTTYTTIAIGPSGYLAYYFWLGAEAAGRELNYGQSKPLETKRELRRQELAEREYQPEAMESLLSVVEEDEAAEEELKQKRAEMAKQLAQAKAKAAAAVASEEVVHLRPDFSVDKGAF